MKADYTNKLMSDYYLIHDELAKFKAINNELKDELKEKDSTIQKLHSKIAKLEAALNNDASNSGIPTSQTPIGKSKHIPNSRVKTDKKKGGQPGHKKHKLESFDIEELTHAAEHKISECSCGHKLHNHSLFATKDEMDIEIVVTKTRHHFYEATCEKCNKLNRVSIPNNLKENNQYGNNIKSLIINLVNEGNMPLKKIKEFIVGVSNNEIDLSVGYIAKQQKNAAKKLADFEIELANQIKESDVIHWDDTVISVNKKRACLRVYCTDNATLYRAHETKGKIGLDEDAILNNLSPTQTVVHDHNKVNYNDEYIFQNAECVQHLLRDLKKVTLNLNNSWAEKMSNLLNETNKRRKELIQNSYYTFDEDSLKRILERYDEIIKKGQEENVESLKKKQYYADIEKTLLKRLVEHKNNYLMFTVNFDVPFTNNISERNLRGIKSKMKVSGQFENVNSARNYARIRSYIMTCKQNGMNVHEVVKRLFKDDIVTIEEIMESN